MKDIIEIYLFMICMWAIDIISLLSIIMISLWGVGMIVHEIGEIVCCLLSGSGDSKKQKLLDNDMKRR